MIKTKEARHAGCTALKRKTHSVADYSVVFKKFAQKNDD